MLLPDRGGAIMTSARSGYEPKAPLRGLRHQIARAPAATVIRDQPRTGKSKTDPRQRGWPACAEVSTSDYCGSRPTRHPRTSIVFQVHTRKLVSGNQRFRQEVSLVRNGTRTVSYVNRNASRSVFGCCGPGAGPSWRKSIIRFCVYPLQS